jgi:hypothetical protein
MKLFLGVIVAAAIVVGVVLASGSSDPDQETVAQERVDIAQLIVGGTGKISTLDPTKGVDQFSPRCCRWRSSGSSPSTRTARCTRTWRSR